MKVYQFYNKNQFIINSGNGLFFQSYDSVIAYYDFKNKTLTLNDDYWCYSKTTTKYLYLFIEIINAYYSGLGDLFNDLASAKNKRLIIFKYTKDDKIVLVNDYTINKMI